MIPARAQLLLTGKASWDKHFTSSIFQGGRKVYVVVEAASETIAPIVVTIRGSNSANRKPYDLCYASGFARDNDSPLRAFYDLGAGDHWNVVDVGLGYREGAEVRISVYTESAQQIRHPSEPEVLYLHIWMKAFLPKNHPGNPGYIKEISPNLYVVEDPLGFECYATDNRMFSSDPGASARMTTNFILVVGSSTVSVQPWNGQPLQKVDYSRHVLCKSGLEIAARKANTDDMHIGTPELANQTAQVTVAARSTNPFYPSNSTPSIRYGGTFTLDLRTKRLCFRGYTGVFPAFEIYASPNSSSSSVLLQRLPEKGTTVKSLFDMGTGIQQSPVDSCVDLNPK